MESLRQWWPLLLPVILLELSLKAVALLDLRRRTASKGPRLAWVLVILFVNLLGPILDLTLARHE